MNKYLTHVLYSFSNAAFWILSLFFILAVCTDVFTKNGKIGSLSIGTKHMGGYNIPVKLRISYPDSTITYSNKTTGYGGTTSAYFNSEYAARYIDSIRNNPDLEITSVKKTNISTSYLLANENKKEGKLQFRSQIEAKGTVVTNSNDWLTQFLLIIYTYSSLLILVFIFYQLKKIFALLYSAIKFSLELALRIKYLGYFILLSLFVKYTSLIILEWNTFNIRLFTTENGRLIDTAAHMDLSLTYDFNLTLLILGLSLVILSTLLKLGNQYEQESKLTI